MIFVGSYGGDFGAKYTLTCLHRESGKMLWDKRIKIHSGCQLFTPEFSILVPQIKSSTPLMPNLVRQNGCLKLPLPSAGRPSIGSGNIYFSTQGAIIDGIPRTIHVTVAIDTGEEVWDFDNQTRWVPKLFRGKTTFNPPIFFDGTIYATGNSKLFALDPATGKKKWVLDSEIKFDFQGFNAHCINENHLLLSSAHAKEIIIVDTKKGTITRELQASSYATTLVDSIAYWSDHDGMIYAFDLEQGEHKWKKQLATKMFGDPIVQEITFLYILMIAHWHSHKETGEIILVLYPTTGIKINSQLRFSLRCSEISFRENRGLHKTDNHE